MFRDFARKLTLMFGLAIPVTGLNISEQLSVMDDGGTKYSLNWYLTDDEIEALGGEEFVASTYPGEAYVEEIKKQIESAPSLNKDSLKIMINRKKGNYAFVLECSFKDNQIPEVLGVTITKNDDGSFSVKKKFAFAEGALDKEKMKPFKVVYGANVSEVVWEVNPDEMSPKGKANGWAMMLTDLISANTYEFKYKKNKGTLEAEAKAKGAKDGVKKEEEGSNTTVIIAGVGGVAVIGGVVFFVISKKKKAAAEEAARLAAEAEEGEDGEARPRRPVAGARPSRPGMARPGSKAPSKPVGRPGARPGARPPMGRPGAKPAPAPEPEPEPEEAAPVEQPVDEFQIIQCGNCQAKLKVRTALRGKTVACAKCKTKIIVE